MGISNRVTGKLESRVLIVYSTWTGATHEVADHIADNLRGKGMIVDVERAEVVRDLTGYTAVLLGNSVHMGKLTRASIEFVERHHAALCNLPVAIFLVCLTLMEDKPEARAQALGYLQPLREKAPQMTPLDIGLFAGAVLTEGEDFKRQDPIRKLIEKGMAKIGDKRDWEAIDAWADKVAPMLAGIPV